MSESDDMKTIVTLLGNLVEKIETVEERVGKIEARMDSKMAAQNEAIDKLAGSVVGLRDAMEKTGDSINGWVEKLDKKDREHHGDLDAWTKDVSIKLTQLGMKIDNKKFKIF